MTQLPWLGNATKPGLILCCHTAVPYHRLRLRGAQLGYLNAGCRGREREGGILDQTVQLLFLQITGSNELAKN